VIKLNGLTYITNGSGSETYDPGLAKPGGFASGAHGFMSIALTSQKLDFSLIDMTGKVLYESTLTNT
jgi:acid phosphatase